MKKYREGTLFAKRTTDVLFKDFAQPFWIWETCPIVNSKIKRGGNITKGYCKSSRALLEGKLIPAFGNKKVSSITTDMVDRWLLDMPKKDNVCHKTANKAFMILKQMLAIAVRQRLISHNPCLEVDRLIEKDSRRGCFTPDEIRSIFHSPWDNEMALTACKLSATTGMRMGEIRALTPEQVHDDYIEVNAACLLDASFASVLVPVIRNRIILLHIWHNSRSGKTAALKFALSVWGDPNVLMGNFHSTAVGLERKAGILKNLPLGVDELQGKSKTLDSAMIVYQLGNGQGKTRGSKNGGLQETLSWENAVITTGEQTLSVFEQMLSQGIESVKIYVQRFIDRINNSRNQIYISSFFLFLRK